MCTLTILPRTDDGLLFSAIMNRDELRSRKKATPPAWQNGIFAPRDTDAGGAWTAINRAGLIGFVLNRTEKDNHYNDGSISRGSLLPILLRASSVNSAVNAFGYIHLEKMRPFYCLLRDTAGQILFTYNGRSLSRTAVPLDQPFLLATSGLGDGLVRPYREARFLEMLANGRNREAQKRFHNTFDPEYPVQSVLMQRDEARTVSITSYAVEENAAVIEYRDIDSTESVQTRIALQAEESYRAL